MSWDDTCSLCGNDLLWWRSRTGYRVCMRCYPDPLGALEILARRGPTRVRQRNAVLGACRTNATYSEAVRSKGESDAVQAEIQGTAAG